MKPDVILTTKAFPWIQEMLPPEFFALDNVVLFPHVASASRETRTAMANLQIENLRLHFAGRPVKTPVTQHEKTHG